MKCLLTKNKNNKIKGQHYVSSLLNSLVWPFLFVLFSYLLNFIFSFIYIYQKGNAEINPTELSDFLNQTSLLMVIITFIIFYPVFSKKYKKFNLPKNKLTIKNVINLSLIAMSLAFSLNLIIYNLNEILNLTNRYENINNQILIAIITTGIIGPILEEYLFRGLLYNKLKQFNKKSVAIILTSIIFAIMHFELTQIIYAFIFSLVLIYIYETYKTLKAPIIMHVIANTSVVLFMNLIVKLNNITSIIILIICIIILFISFKILKLDNNRT